MPELFISDSTRVGLQNFIIGDNPNWPWPIAGDLTCEHAQAIRELAAALDLTEQGLCWLDDHRAGDACEGRCEEPPNQPGRPVNAPLTIGATSGDGTFQIVDTRPGDHGLLFVTVREMIGDGCLDMSDAGMVRAMRRLAHRAYPGHVRHSPVHHRSTAYHCAHVTFAISGANDEAGQ